MSYLGRQLRCCDWVRKTNDAGLKGKNCRYYTFNLEEKPIIKEEEKNATSKKSKQTESENLIQSPEK